MTVLVRRLIHSKHFIVFFLLLVLATHIPTGKGVLLGDDFIQWAAATTPDVLADKGFSIADASNSFSQRIKNTFLFMSADNSATQELKDYGAIPWWSPDDITMHMFRPLAGITHWIDYQFLGGDVFLMQLHTVIYLLMLTVSYFALCKALNMPSWTPMLAIGLFVFSYSMPMNMNWLASRNAIIAPMFAIWALVFHHHWRIDNQPRFLIYSLLALLLALLSAEAGIAILAYLGAYAIILDPKRSVANVWTIIPALLVVALWRLGYSSEGFGTENIDLYVDPVRSPKEFLTQQLPTLPLFYGKMLLGPLAAVMLLVSSSTLVLSLISLVVCLLALWLISPQLRRNRLMQFGALASVIALIPFLSTTPGSRSEPFMHIGLFITLSLWVYLVLQQTSVSTVMKTVVGAFLVIHLALPTIGTAARHWRLITLEVKGADAYSSVAAELADGKTNLVLVNSPDYFAYYHRPFGWAYHNQPLPNKIQLLAPGLTRIQVTRKSEYIYDLRSEEGFAFIGADPQDVDTREDPQGNRLKVVGYRANNEIVTNRSTRFHQGQIILSNGYSVTIKEMDGPRPIALSIEFHSNEPSVWQWFDWSDLSYKKFSTLAVGDAITLPGPFDAVAPDDVATLDNTAQ